MKIFTFFLLLILFSVEIFAQDRQNILEEVIVSVTGQEKKEKDIAQSFVVARSDDINFVSASHPSQYLNRMSGVYVNNLGGGGHMTSIRQPLSTKGVYLFLEDGVPIRPTGLFNHNALYEINIVQSDRVEVVKGPGSALYGSDAIGGVINSLTRPTPEERQIKTSYEYGSYGWKRGLVSTGSKINDNIGFLVDANITSNEGYREHSQYNRNSLSAKIDGFIGDNSKFKTIFSFNDVEQSGVSSLSIHDYKNDRKKNLFHNNVGRRLVDSYRLTSEFIYEPEEDSLFSFTPILRYYRMKLMPSWMLNYDPNGREYGYESYGLMSKYHRKFLNSKIELIKGLDIDYTPSSYKEFSLNVEKEGELVVNARRNGAVNYDFEVDQASLSPYVRLEWLLHEKIRLSGGLRYDYFKVDYSNNLDTSHDQGRHLRPSSQKLSYDSVSPKFGMIYNVAKNQYLFANYRHSFRAPSVSQLFRSGSVADSQNLNPIKAKSVEIGARGQLFNSLGYDFAIYRMTINDDIVSYIDNNTNDRKVKNAGKTVHQGVEASLNGEIGKDFSFRGGFSLRDQRYLDYEAYYGRPGSETFVNYSGNKVAKAPSSIGNISLIYSPFYLPKSKFEIEWQHLGDYYVDEINGYKYNGHNLFNFRSSILLNNKIGLNFKIINIFNKVHSVYTSNQVGSQNVQYMPGSPRSYYLAVKMDF